MTKILTITEPVAGQRLDAALAAISGISRSQIQKALREQRVRGIDNAIVSTKAEAVAGQQFEILDAESPLPQAIPNIPVIYEDENLIVVDKPARLAVHLGESQRPQPTVAAFASARGVKDSDKSRPGIVHRLDKDTSGVMVIAKTPEVKEFLQVQFRNRTAEKTYLALVRGRLKADQAEIRLPIGRSRQNPLKRAVVPGSRAAKTAYRVIGEYPGATLLEVQLHTGRTHQIRVHFSHLGHPIIGDSLYGESDSTLGRQFLHAKSLVIDLPGGERKSFSSQLPDDLSAYLNHLEKQV